MCDWDKPRSTNLERVLYLCQTLDWCWSDVLQASTFTRGKTLTFLSMQKMCAEVDAHKKWMTFIRRPCQIINEFWHTIGSRSSKCSIYYTTLCWTTPDWYCCSVYVNYPTTPPVPWNIFLYCLVHIDIQVIYSVNFIFAQSSKVDIGLEEKIRLVHQIFFSVQTNI